jgi:hypothetical protein
MREKHMVSRVTLAATLVASTLALFGPVVAARAADQPARGDVSLPPDAKEAIDLGNPHRSRLTTQQQDQLDRAADLRQQQEIAQWSKLLGGEQAQVQPTPGGGVANPHEQQAQTPGAQGQELPLH